MKRISFGNSKRVSMDPNADMRSKKEKAADLAEDRRARQPSPLHSGSNSQKNLDYPSAASLPQTPPPLHTPPLTTLHTAASLLFHRLPFHPSPFHRSQRLHSLSHHLRFPRFASLHSFHTLPFHRSQRLHARDERRAEVALLRVALLQARPR
eukprot:2646235-Prymnesium_polylepis.2